MGARLHFTSVFELGSEVDGAVPVLCPTGEDCFYTISAFRDGGLVLDDERGRVSATLDDGDLMALRTILDSRSFQQAVGTTRMDCPATDADVKIAITTAWADGVERFHSLASGCLAGDLTGLEEHPVYRLRLLLDEQLRWTYSQCDSADENPRPLCRDFEFVDVGDMAR